MSKELDIPILRDLISSGITEAQEVHKAQEPNLEHEASLKHEDIDLEIPEDDLFSDADHEQPVVTPEELEDDDHIEDYASVQELLIEEEVRLILDKHMEAAYEEIIRLIHHKLK